MTKTLYALICPVFVLLTSFTTTACRAATPMTQAEREDYLRRLDKILPPLPSWDEWQRKTGALPPDFNSLPKINELPDPLIFLDGRPVRTASDWERRRQEISDLSQKYE